jgi:hypothetical protein
MRQIPPRSLTSQPSLQSQRLAQRKPVLTATGHDVDILIICPRTITVTDSTVTFQKRQTMATVQASIYSSIFSSILGRPSSDVAQVCSYLLIPMTTTITNVQTASSTTTITPIVSGNYTITPPIVTLQITETHTEIIDVTSITATTTMTEVATAAVKPSIVTITSTYESTYTTIQATPTTNIETIITCTAGTVSPVGSCQNTVYAVAGTYYSEQCDNIAVTGSVRINGPGVKDINSCLSYCGHFSAYCNVAIYNPTSTYCQLVQTAASGSIFSSGYQAVAVHSTNPCFATITNTGYGYETITTQIVTVYESTVTSSTSSILSSTSIQETPLSSTTASVCSVSPAATVSVVTLTSTYATTYTDISAITTSSTETVTTCTPSAFTAGQCQNGVYTLGTKYYQQYCNGVSLSGGATVLVLPAAQIAYCNQYCSVYSTICSGYNYNTLRIGSINWSRRRLPGCQSVYNGSVCSYVHRS